jgi:putative ABC transport system permease protein
MQTIRSLLRAPTFTVIAIGVLALGIGASAALFSVVDGVLLRPLPYAQADRLVSVTAAASDGGGVALSYPQFLDWRAQARSSLEEMAFASGQVITLHGAEGASRVPVAYVSEGFFALLGTRPLLGRFPSPDEERPSGPRVLVLSHSFWRSHFGGDPSAIGRTVDTDEGSYTVIAVMPPAFHYPDWATCWAPLGPRLAQIPDLAQRDWRADSRVIARLAPGVAMPRATAELDAIARRLGTEYREDPALRSHHTTSPDALTRDVRPSLFVLAGAVGVLLLIACANVANLSLVRGRMRARELAVRVALGADARRIALLLLQESVVLALAGGALGFALAWGAVRLLRVAAPAELPRADEIALDWRVLAFTVTLSLLTPLLFGLVPALQMRRLDLSEMMKQGSRGGGATRRDARARSALIVAQVALSLVLLVGAGILARSFIALRATSPGFEPDHLVMIRIDGAERQNDTPEKLLGWYRRLKEAVGALPGARRVALINHLPMSGAGVPTRLEPDGQHVEPGQEPTAAFRLADEDYFATVQQPIIHGRAFTASDMVPSSHAVIVTASLARQLWPGQDAIGKRLRVFKQAVGRPDYGQPVEGEVVGVSGDVKFRSLADSASPEVYLPMPVNPWRNTFLVARVQGDDGAFIAAMRRAIAAVAPDVPLNGITTVSTLISNRLAERRFSLGLLGAFAGVALVLATVGIYGVIAYGVTQRHHEIGVRSALGASRGALTGLFVRQGLALALLGVALGIPLAAAATRLLASLVYGVSAHDAVTFAAVAVGLTLVAVLAAYVPARRAARVDPVIALRNE